MSASTMSIGTIIYSIKTLSGHQMVKVAGNWAKRNRRMISRVRLMRPQ